MPSYRVPEVYVERRARAEAAPAVRTDVVGFLGLEPRVRPGTTPSRAAPDAAFLVDVARFEVELAGRRELVERRIDLDLLGGAGGEPILEGQAIAFSLVVARRDAFRGAIVLLPVAGLAAPIGSAAPPSDAEITAAVAALPPLNPPGAPPDPWLRAADVIAARRGAAIALAVRPRLGPVRCDDWRDFVDRLGEPADDGLLLGAAVRAFFANGGGRAWIVTVTRPPLEDPAGLEAARAELVGVAGSSARDATGLERLLLVDEVSVIDVPDLHGRRVVLVEEPPLVLPRDVEAGFTPCAGVRGGVPVAVRTREQAEPLFSDLDVRATQKAMLARCQAERWRVLLLCSPPLERDPVDGRWRSPPDAALAAWAADLATIGDDLERSCAALYAPWVLAQERAGAPVTDLPPTPFVAGVIARRDLARGPHVAPANEPLRGVVALAGEPGGERDAALYGEPPFVNLLRPFPGEGIRVWGSRTLSADAWLRWISVRRGLSAIERRMAAALQPLVFEPSTPMLWLQVTQIALATLLPPFEAGALRGDTAEEAFYVRCGPSNNPPEAVQEGRLLCEVGVALAAPAEFIVFRLGRREGVVEVLE